MSHPETETKTIDERAQEIHIGGLCGNCTTTTVICAGDPRRAEQILAAMGDSIELTRGRGWDYQKEAHGRYTDQFADECVRELRLDADTVVVRIIIEGAREPADRLVNELTEGMLGSAATRAASEALENHENA